MSWSTFLYAYHQLHGGRFLGSGQEDSLLILSHKGQPLAVEPYTTPGRYGGTYIRARIPVTLERPFSLTIGAESNLSLGVNAARRTLGALPGAGGLTEDYGCPQVTKNRSVRTSFSPFARLVLNSPDLRAALPASPREKLAVSPGPGEEGTHLVTVTTGSAGLSPLGLEGGGWYLGPVSDDFFSTCGAQEREYVSRRMESEFFPRLDGFLSLARAFWDALTAWPMPSANR